MVAQLILDQFVLVQIQVGQPTLTASRQLTRREAVVLCGTSAVPARPGNSLSSPMPDTTSTTKLILVTRNGWPDWSLPESAQPVLRLQPESDPADALDKAPDARLILAAPCRQTAAWTRELLRRKRHFALGGLNDDDRNDLARLAAAARKRRLAPVVLGSWRCLPPVLALRELTAGGMLGQLTRMDIATPPHDTFAGEAAAADLTAFLNPANHPLAFTLTTNSQPDQLTIAMTGTAGTATATGALNGGNAYLETAFGGHARTIRLHPGHPARTELCLFLAAHPDGQTLMTITTAADITPTTPRTPASHGQT